MTTLSSKILKYLTKSFLLFLYKLKSVRVRVGLGTRDELGFNFFYNN